MTPYSRWITTVLRGQSDSETHRECRRCGTTVHDDGDPCPDCGGTEIASYRLSE